ncbi:hypothetical protein C4K00_2923 [Pseudomonas synxantha]|nr:hypothetical protein C4K00_2923 [Pseudomonas synxantha]
MSTLENVLILMIGMTIFWYVQGRFFTWTSFMILLAGTIILMRLF